MAIKDQLSKLKDNWLLILIPLVLLFMFAGGFSWLPALIGGFAPSSYESAPSGDYGSSFGGIPDISAAPRASSGSFGEPSTAAKDRMIAKTAGMDANVERGAFPDAEAELNAIVESSGAYLLEQNVQTYDEGIAQYKVGRYRIKIDAAKYDEVIPRLKELGKLDSFTEDAEDVTQAYTDIGIELENEKKRLARYEALYNEATSTEDKISLSDRIINQEYRISYLEQSLKDVGEQVVYSTIDVTLREEQSGYAELSFVGLSDLVKAFVGSLSGVIYLLVLLLPWALGIWLVVWLVRKLRGKRKNK